MLLTSFFNSLMSNYGLAYTSWPMFFLTLLVSIIILKSMKHWVQMKGKNLPPGPWGVPILGYQPFLTDRMHEDLMQLGKKYGDVFRLNLLGEETVILNSYEAIREAYLVQGKRFSGLPQANNFNMWMTDGHGIFQEEGEIWETNRRFILRTFRDFGFGSRVMESKIQSVAEDLVGFLKKENGRPCNVSAMLNNCTVNVICSILFDKQYQIDDPEFRQLLKITSDIVKNFQGTINFLSFGPWIYLLPTFWKLRGMKKSLIDFVNRFILDHEATMNSEFPRDYTEAYLQRMHRLEKDKTPERRFFSKEQLIGNALNFAFAGVDTTANTVLWGLLMLAQHPEMQERIQKEIDSVVGTEQLPTYEHRTKMPFFEAFLMEVNRYATIVPIAPAHSVLEETTLQGFAISKRTTVIANIWAAHRDENHFPNADTFDPNRFLDENGLVMKGEALIPFSIGKRNCVGEALARMEIVIFIVAVLQKFVIRAPEGVDLSKVGDFISFIRVLKPFEICAIPRT